MGGRRRWLVAAALVALLAGSGAAGSTPRGERVLYFGDSLFAGAGVEPRHPVQPQVANKLLGWHGVVDAVGGTGYTTGGKRGRPYGERLRGGVLSEPFDVIVLEGGTNDARHGSLPRLRQEALAVLDYIERRQPEARVVMVGGFAYQGAPARYVVMDQILSEVAADRGVEYVSQLGYASRGDGFYSPDRLHPTAGGYAQLGRDLAAALGD